MTDLEMNKLCAEAMGLTVTDDSPLMNVSGILVAMPKDTVTLHGALAEYSYNPLHDDAQALALVKQFKLHTYWEEEREPHHWECEFPDNTSRFVSSESLNYAIVECVAKMQAAKVTATSPPLR